MLKQINLGDGNRWLISVEPGYCTNMVSFSKGFIENEEVIKSIDFAIWDDMSIHVYLSSHEYPDYIDFFFDLHDPIYFCLDELLGEANTFVIDDDDSCEILKKYMKIEKVETGIKIIFVNTKNERIHHNKFGVFIKNIGPDGRSKIEDINIKYRIVDFFRSCAKCLLEEYHQITFREYIETLRVKENEKLIRKLKKQV